MPGLLGALAGAFAAPLLGLWAGVGFGLLICFLAAVGLTRLRRHRTPYRAYRLALLAWIAVAVWLGASRSVPHPAAAPQLAERTAWSEAGAFRAGVGEAAFALPPETTLAGWGAPPRRETWPAFGGLGPLGKLSLRVLGAPREGAPPRVPLFRRPGGPGEILGARALVLVPEGEAPAVAFVRLDLTAVSASLASEIRAGVPSVRLTPATLIVTATHTHSGPGGFHRAPLATVAGTDHFDVRVRAAVRRAAIEAIEEAVREAVPARIAPFASRDRGANEVPILARNRTGDAQPIDDRVRGFRIEPVAGDGDLLAVLLNYAIQPVILRIRHMAFGRDMAGALEDALAGALPGRPLVLFVNGAFGDQSPRGTYGNGVEAARRLAAAFVARIRDDVLAPAATDRLRVAAARVAWDAGSPHTFVAAGPRPAFADRVVPSALGQDLPGHIASLIALPANALAWSLGLFEIRFGFTFDGAVGVLVNLDRLAGERERHAGALLFEMPGLPPRSARSLVLWQGGIPTQAVGRRWRTRAAARNLETPLLLSLANDGSGYLTTGREYDGSSYEAQATLLGRDGALGMERALDLAVQAVLGDGPGEGAGLGGG